MVQSTGRENIFSQSERFHFENRPPSPEGPNKTCLAPAGLKTFWEDFEIPQNKRSSNPALA